MDAGSQGGFYAADDNSFSLTADQVASLRNGEFYANIHTTTEAGGEIRGQILPEINFFPSSSDLTLPLPGASINVAGLEISGAHNAPYVKLLEVKTAKGKASDAKTAKPTATSKVEGEQD